MRRSRRYVPPHLRAPTSPNPTNSTATSLLQSRNIATRRLVRDLAELQRTNIPSIAAHPIDDNIFEWHVNIKPTEGVYSGVYFHLIMTFPESYPTHPPKIKICTPISHPNIFNEFLCLSMLRPHTRNVPYEGWSSAYSVTSILMQLQSFLFAEKIDQDGGYQLQAKLSGKDVQTSVHICKTFICHKCKHSHSNPWPYIKPSESVIKICGTALMDPQMIFGTMVQSTDTRWVGARAEFGCARLDQNTNRIMYEACIEDVWHRGLCRFGFGTSAANICGCDQESFGYGGTGKYSYLYNFTFGESFSKNDTITVALDFDNYRIYFAKNGKLLERKTKLCIHQYLRDKKLFPVLALKNSRVAFNFGIPKKPCAFLMQNGFKTLEEIVSLQKEGSGEQKSHNKGEYIVSKVSSVCNWDSQYIIPELWVCIFEGLLFEDIFSVQFVCKRWYDLVNRHNLLERHEIMCYFSKAKLCIAPGKNYNNEILGIGLSVRSSNIEGHGLSIHSQWDCLSLNAWNNGCHTGVWGEELSHFLPLVFNKNHSRLAETEIIYHLLALTKLFCTIRRSNINELEMCINRSQCLKLMDTLATMMNLIVVQFVMGNKKTDSHTVSMTMCEKVVLGYCSLHHLLLYLVSQNKHEITAFANKCVSLFINDRRGCEKRITRDLGKFLIYLMVSKYEWNDVAHIFVTETLTRNVLWMATNVEYSSYNTTNVVKDRLRNTFNASLISHRLVMFQVWFMQNNSLETLHGYNQRLGRPNIEIKNAIFNKTKEILNCKLWSEYFNELDVSIESDTDIDRLLRFAVYNSDQKGYHRPGFVRFVKPPKIAEQNCKYNGMNTENEILKEETKEDSALEWRRKQPRVGTNSQKDINQSKPQCIEGSHVKQPKMSKSQRRKLRRKKNVNSKWVSPIRPQPKGKNGNKEYQ